MIDVLEDSTNITSTGPGVQFLVAAWIYGVVVGVVVVVVAVFGGEVPFDVVGNVVVAMDDVIVGVEQAPQVTGQSFMTRFWSEP